MKTLILCILILCACSVQAAENQWSVSACYAKSFSGHVDGIAYKISVPLVEFALPFPGTKLQISADGNAVPVGEGLAFGPGGSFTFKTEKLGLNFGIGYFPRDYGWSWTAQLLKIDL